MPHLGRCSQTKNPVEYRALFPCVAPSLVVTQVTPNTLGVVPKTRLRGGGTVAGREEDTDMDCSAEIDESSAPAQRGEDSSDELLASVRDEKHRARSIPE